MWRKRFGIGPWIGVCERAVFTPHWGMGADSWWNMLDPVRVTKTENRNAGLHSVDNRFHSDIDERTFFWESLVQQEGTL